MKTVRINARGFVADIRSGKDDFALQQKYGLEQEDLVQLKNELLARRFLSIEDLKCQPGPLKTRIRINPERFLYDFRHTPDDDFLMRKYSLNPQQLKRVYTHLMENQLLTQAEYDGRVRKDPAVDATQESLSVSGEYQMPSDPITLVDEDSEVSYLRSMRDSELPKEFFLDYSGIRIGGPGRSGSSGGASGSQVHEIRCKDHELFEGLREGEYCPNCGTPVRSASSDSCLKCGVVFSKMRKRGKIVTGALWDDSGSKR